MRFRASGHSWEIYPLIIIPIMIFFIFNNFFRDKLTNFKPKPVYTFYIVFMMLAVFYNLVKPVNGARWYDKDPIISKTVEILRIVPPEAQKICAQNFIRTLNEMGIEYTSPNKTEEK